MHFAGSQDVSPGMVVHRLANEMRHFVLVECLGAIRDMDMKAHGMSLGLQGPRGVEGAGIVVQCYKVRLTGSWRPSPHPTAQIHELCCGIDILGSNDAAVCKE